MHNISLHQTAPHPPLITALLFLVFNRLETTRRVFETIRRVKPPRLYIAADGPRRAVPDEHKKVMAVRDQVINRIDWDCDVKTLFRDENLGCKYAVSEAITWFFENEKEGIILEDDCLPSQSFFWFCQELLEKYRDEPQIMHISGFNPLAAYPIEESYCFSRFGPIWGWASWQRAWHFYDVQMASWPAKKARLLRERMVHSVAEMRWRKRLFDKVYMNKIDTWDYQWSYARLAYHGLSIIPRINLVANIGFWQDSTHPFGHVPTHFQYNAEMDRPLSHPRSISEDCRFGKIYLQQFAMPGRFSSAKKLGRWLASFGGKKDRARSRRQWNSELDKKVKPLAYDELYFEGKPRYLMFEIFNRSSDSYWQWLKKAGSHFLKFQYPHKKALEFFFSANLLRIQQEDIVLDAAGGRSEYLLDIRRVTGCQNLYVNDRIYKSGQAKRDGITVVGGDITTIGLADNSVTKISCHHALEHFRGDKDTRFILEIARLLKPSGRACLIPLFLSDCYTEAWNKTPEAHYDTRSLCLTDLSSSLPGADDDGHFARIYDCKALLERLLSVAAAASLNPLIVECTLDGQSVPDMDLNFGSHINRPLRALVLEKSPNG